MKQKPKIACVILAGGASVRFGSHKGLARLHNRPLVEHVVQALRTQTSGAIAINAKADSPYAGYADTILPDLLGEDMGPLSGLYAALNWAHGNDDPRVLTCAIDTPFLPDDLVEKLSAAEGAAIAKSYECIHPVCGIWPTTLMSQLEQQLAAGKGAAHIWAQTSGAVEIAFGKAGEPDPFFNINTPEDLAAASKL
jgi:molybdopterin-guanine dinucleotide biosynthesis protein A